MREPAICSTPELLKRSTRGVSLLSIVDHRPRFNRRVLTPLNPKLLLLELSDACNRAARPPGLHGLNGADQWSPGGLAARFLASDSSSSSGFGLSGVRTLRLNRGR